MKLTKASLFLPMVVLSLTLLGGAGVRTGQVRAMSERRSLQSARSPFDAVTEPGVERDLSRNLLGTRGATSPTSSGSSAVLTWQIETVDDGGWGGDVGQFSSLALDADGHPHVSTYNARTGDLKYAYYDGSGWISETVDSKGDVGQYASLALDSNGRPHISYYDATNGVLKYATREGESWQIEPVDDKGDVGAYSSLALDSMDYPHVSYQDVKQKALKYAVRRGSSWSRETVDDSGNTGWYTSLAIGSEDQPCITYIGHPESYYVRFACREGRAWDFDFVYESASRAPAFTSLSLGAKDRPHVAFHLGPALTHAVYALMYATRDGSGWSSGAVDSAGLVGQYPSLALDPAGHPHISYYREGDKEGDLKCAYSFGDTWYTEVVDSDGDVGRHTSLELDALGQPHVAYYDASHGDLKYASDVPLRFQRQAAQLVAEMRGTEMAPGWETAQLGPGVEPMYRPDVEGIAYYEFPVVASPILQSDLAGFEPAGFIIVSTGDHDFPIPHWDFAAEPPSRRLKAVAEEGGDTAKRFYKLDTLAYAGENEQAELVANLGALPPKVSGFDPAWLSDPPSFEAIWAPEAQAEGDGGADQISGTFVVSGTLAPPPSLEREPWDSWKELKGGYGGTYGPLLEALHQEASQAWEAESQSQEGGFLRKGDVRVLAMLWSAPVVSLRGEGAGYVEDELIEQPGLAPNLRITVLDSVLGATLPLTVTVEYPNGLLETFSFTVIEPYEVWLPLILRSSFGGMSLPVSGAAGVRPQSVAGWTDWSYIWAGNHTDQRWYNQIPSGESPNTSECWSGCAATAWAMLFGWADYQAAHGNPYWQGRWGLYRQGGGYGADVVAPSSMDEGVKDMIWEIRNDVDTWCNLINDNGATWASDMSDARQYLVGRSYTRILTWGNNASVHRAKYRRKAKAAIQYRAPAVIGIGLWEHYPLAYGFKKRRYRFWGTTWYTQRKFYVNMGWGDSSNRGWVSAYPVWFAGEIRPHVPVQTNAIDDVALHRDGDHTWYYDYGHDGDRDAVSPAWGKQTGDVPLAGDFDRDGLADDTAVFRIDASNNGRWYYNYDHDGDTDEQSGPWGWAGDLPIAGDFDGDGYLDDVAVYRPSAPHIWYYDYDHDGDTDATSGSWGWAGDRPFAGDFDRDGIVDDVAVFRPSTHMAYYDYNHDGTTDEQVTHITTETGLPVAADFDGDGFVDDVAFFIPDWEPVSFWIFDHNHDGVPNGAAEWGWEDGLPVAGAFGENEDPD